MKMEINAINFNFFIKLEVVLATVELINLIRIT